MQFIFNPVHWILNPFNYLPTKYRAHCYICENVINQTLELNKKTFSKFFGSTTIIRFLFQSIRIPHDIFNESEFWRKKNSNVDINVNFRWKKAFCFKRWIGKANVAEISFLWQCYLTNLILGSCHTCNLDST